jgi:hypothetical protein
MLPKKDNKLPPGRGGSNHHLNFNGAIAAALRKELGSTHRAIKTVMHWTGASESAVKTWLAGSHGPSGDHLVALVRNSDEVLKIFLLLAGRNENLLGVRLAALRSHLVKTIQFIDGPD